MKRASSKTRLDQMDQNGAATAAPSSFGGFGANRSAGGQAVAAASSPFGQPSGGGGSTFGGFGTMAGGGAGTGPIGSAFGQPPAAPAAAPSTSKPKRSTSGARMLDASPSPFGQAAGVGSAAPFGQAASSSSFPTTGAFSGAGSGGFGQATGGFGSLATPSAAPAAQALAFGSAFGRSGGGGPGSQPPGRLSEAAEPAAVFQSPLDFAKAVKQQRQQRQQPPKQLSSRPPASQQLGQQQQRQQRQPQAAARDEDVDLDHDENDEEVFDEEAEKRKALASMPTFVGGGGGGSSAAAPAAYKPPALRKPPMGAQQGAVRPGGGIGIDQGAGALAARAARFGGGGSGGGDDSTPAGPSWQTGATASGDEDHRPGGGCIVGTCTDMCPAEERGLRERTQTVRLFERPDPRNPGRTSAELAVKSFARTGIDEQGPKAFRTRETLVRTMDHLRRIMDRTDAPFSLIHNFLFDRYRSVRQDLYVQGIEDEFACEIFEEIIRYHILCEHELCESEATVSDHEGFSSHLNVEQMNKALISLLDMYKVAQDSGVPRDTDIEAEFRAYHLCTIMAQHGKFAESRLQFYTSLQAMRPEVQQAAPVQLVLRLRCAMADNNYVAFFQLMRRAPYLLACLAHAYFPAVRAAAFGAICTVFSPGQQALPLSFFVSALMLDDEAEAAELCALYNLPLEEQRGTSVAVINKLAVKPGAELEKPANRRSAAISDRMLQPPSANVTRAGATATAGPEAAARHAALQAARQAEAAKRQQQLQARVAGSMAWKEEQQQGAQVLEAERHQRQQHQQAQAAQQQQEQVALRRQAEAAQQQRQQHLQQLQQEQAAAAQRVEQQQQRLQEQQRAVAAAAEAAQQQQAEAAAQQAEQRRREEAAVEQRRRQQEAEKQRREQEQRRREAEAVARRRAEQQAAAARAAAERRAAEERERARQAALAAARAAEVARLQRVLRLRLAAHLWARAARQSAAGRAALRLAAVRLGTPPARRPRQAADEPHWLGPPPGLGHPPQGAPAAPAAAASAAPARSAVDTAALWRPADVASALLPGLAAANLAAHELVAKLVVAADASGSSGFAAQWLRAKLAGPGRSSDGGQLLPGEVLAACAVPVWHWKAAARLLRLCVRDLSTPAAKAEQSHKLREAAAGASGIIVLAEARSVAATALPAPLQAAIAATAREVPLPLLVLTTDRSAGGSDSHVGGGSRHLQNGSSAALDEEAPEALAQTIRRDSSSSGSGVRISAVKVISISSHGGGEAGLSEAALLQGLAWLAAQAPPQPQLWVGSLEAAARREVDAALAPLRGVWTRDLPDWLAAFNCALGATLNRISEARQSTVGTWGWPPPELAGPVPLLQPAEGGAAAGKRPRLVAGQPAAEQRAAPPLGPPSDWHAADMEAALATALQAAALPPALDGAAPGAAVHEYIASIAPEVGRAATSSSSEAASDMAWQQRLESAFGARLSQLGVPHLPRVVLPPPREPAETEGAVVSLQLIGNGHPAWMPGHHNGTSASPQRQHSDLRTPAPVGAKRKFVASPPPEVVSPLFSTPGLYHTPPRGALPPLQNGTAAGAAGGKTATPGSQPYFTPPEVPHATPLQQANGIASTPAAGSSARRRMPGDAALDKLERDLAAEARDGHAFQSRLLHAVSGPSSAIAASPSAGVPVQPPAGGAEDATDEGLEAAVAAEVDAASGLTARLRELCAL